MPLVPTVRARSVSLKPRAVGLGGVEGAVGRAVIAKLAIARSPLPRADPKHRHRSLDRQGSASR